MLKASIPPSVWHFNSQPHEEADVETEITDYSGGYFNSQPHEEADRWKSYQFGSLLYFNSQPHEEADIAIIIAALLDLYFNSQPHEEADIIVHDFCKVIHISTHSLTRRLTILQGGIIEPRIFQLTASRGG